MKASASVQVGEVKDVLAVPNDAIQDDRSGRPMVKVLRNGDWREAVVEVGLSDGSYTEIRGGLEEGDTVQVKRDLL
jgi:multidrug efflux pump subunit AcrA (membrane-fusion protein)